MLKKIKHTIILMVVAITTTWAQSPNQINYQGVARDAAGNPLANQNIKVRLKIRNNTAGGTVQYSEVRALTTAANGLFTIQIGSAGAALTSGSFAAITWATAPKFLQVELDPAGGTNYVNMGTQQLVSVPYAQYSTIAGTLKFPVSATDSLAASMLYLNNKNNTAIEAYSRNGSAVYGYSSNNAAISAANNSTNQPAVSAYNYNTGAGVFGYSQNGIAVAAQNGNATWPAIQGTNNLGIGVKGQSGSANGAGVIGTCNHSSGYGVIGENTNGGWGVYGKSNGGGTGVLGTSDNWKGVSGQSNAGIGLYGSSSTGYALFTDGKVRFATGSGTPAQGKVLTSDANGNATWQGAVAFKEFGINIYYTTVYYNSDMHAMFDGEVYDLGNNYDISLQKFTVPTNGIYHFDSQIGWLDATDNITCFLTLMLKRNGNISSIISNQVRANTGDECNNSLSGDFNLLTGDEIWIETKQWGDSHSNTENMAFCCNAFFCGRLVIKL